MDSSPPNPPAPDVQPLLSAVANTRSRSDLVWRTLREALLMFGVNIVLGGVLFALNLRFLLPSTQNTDNIAALVSNPFALFLLGVVVAPLWEELVFRGLPSWLLRRLRHSQNRDVATRDAWFWALAIVSSLAFAVLHGINKDGQVHLPLPQLITGFLLWHTAISRGLRYSILMHATYNSIALFLVLLGGSALKEALPQPKTDVQTTSRVLDSRTR